MRHTNLCSAHKPHGTETGSREPRQVHISHRHRGWARGDKTSADKTCVAEGRLREPRQVHTSPVRWKAVLVTDLQVRMATDSRVCLEEEREAGGKLCECACPLREVPVLLEGRRHVHRSLCEHRCHHCNGSQVWGRDCQMKQKQSLQPPMTFFCIMCLQRKITDE